MNLDNDRPAYRPFGGLATSVGSPLARRLIAKNRLGAICALGTVRCGRTTEGGVASYSELENRQNFAEIQGGMQPSRMAFTTILSSGEGQAVSAQKIFSLQSCMSNFHTAENRKLGLSAPSLPLA